MTTIDTSVVDALSKEDYKEFYETLHKLPKSKYAIPTNQIVSDLMGENFNGDLAFFEVREYKKTPYIRRLVGAPSYFTRYKMSKADSLAFVRILSQDPLGYAQLFGMHYRCCGKCGAELTDERSRELSLGPECRKTFGLK
jgi:hypothetical protein